MVLLEPTLMLVFPESVAFRITTPGPGADTAALNSSRVVTVV